VAMAAPQATARGTKVFDLGQRVRRRWRHMRCPGEQKFFGSFFQKRTASLNFPLRLP
jgi:hypothetical protein